MDKVATVAIIGAGQIGAAAALAQRGIEVTL
jgi:hypothetical protein